MRKYYARACALKKASRFANSIAAAASRALARIMREYSGKTFRLTRKEGRGCAAPPDFRYYGF